MMISYTTYKNAKKACLTSSKTDFFDQNFMILTSFKISMFQ